MVQKLAQVSRPHANQRSAVELGVASDPVVNARMELAPAAMEPGFVGLVASQAIDGARGPVSLLARQEIAAFQDQDALTGGSERACHGAATSARANDDHIVIGRVHARPYAEQDHALLEIRR